MIEANPDLSPAEMKEILKLTAERRGEPTLPDIDPFYNRDFGWGMVDALAAVELAFFLKDNNLTGQIDVTSQVHVTNSSLNSTTGLFQVRGIAWGQAGSISAVEGRFGQGPWMQATYEPVEGGLGALERFEWVIAINPLLLPAGEQVLEIRGLNEESKPSLPVFAVVIGQGSASDSATGLTFGAYFTLVNILIVFIIIGLVFKARADEPLLLAGHDKWDGHPDVLDAELVPDDGSTLDDEASS
jgi:hypothetical protein